MKDRPTYTKWNRKAGGVKACRDCRHRHNPVMRIDGKPVRVKTCVKCGAKLPSRLTHPKKSAVKWFVREFDPVTGKTRDHACSSSEDADELIRRKQRDFTRDPIQERLLDYTSTLIRQIEAKGYDCAVNELIERLGGDATARSLKPVGWDEAVQTICAELRDRGLSGAYVDNMARTASDLAIVTRLGDWAQVDLDSIAEYRRVRLAGGWKRNGRVVRAVGGEALNGDLRTLSAFLARAVTKGWVARNVLEGAADARVKVKTGRVVYMPDSDLRTLIAAADKVWFRAFLMLAYYTGARRGDLLLLEWERDVDLAGDKVASEGRIGPHIFIRGSKSDMPHWTPLHPVAVETLKGLRRQPVIDAKVFPVRESTNPGCRVSYLFAELCVTAGLTTAIERNGKTVVKNRWKLHDVRRKANTDLRNHGASAKEREAILGHRTSAVNEAHYEALLPERERALIDALPAFGMTA